MWWKASRIIRLNRKSRRPRRVVDAVVAVDSSVAMAAGVVVVRRKVVALVLRSLKEVSLKVSAPHKAAHRDAPKAENPVAADRNAARGDDFFAPAE